VCSASVTSVSSGRSGSLLAECCKK
jgi:hypothetical protein